MAPQSPPLVRDQLSTAAVRCRHAASAPSVLDGVVCSQQLETPPNAATGGENGHVVGRARHADGPSPPRLSLLPASVESRAVLSYPRLGANFGRRSLESPTSRAGSALLTVPPTKPPMDCAYSCRSGIAHDPRWMCNSPVQSPPARALFRCVCTGSCGCVRIFFRVASWSCQHLGARLVSSQRRTI